MLVRINAKGAHDFASELGEYNVLTNKLQLWFSKIYIANEDVDDTMVIKEFNIPADCKKIELVDHGGDEILAVPLQTFKDSFVPGKGFVFHYKDWKKKYMKMF